MSVYESKRRRTRGSEESGDVDEKPTYSRSRGRLFKEKIHTKRRKIEQKRSLPDRTHDSNPFQSLWSLQNEGRTQEVGR